jgi:hypothetical protein
VEDLMRGYGLPRVVKFVREFGAKEASFSRRRAMSTPRPVPFFERRSNRALFEADRQTTDYY